MSDFPWFGQYDRFVPREIEVPDQTLPQFLEERVFRRYRSEPALRLDRFTWSYADLRRLLGAVARRLLSEGLAPARRWAIVLPNLPQTAVLHLGNLYAGNTSVFLNPLYSVSELSYLLRVSEVSGVWTLDLLQEKVLPAARECGLPVWVTHIGDLLPSGVRVAGRWLRRLPHVSRDRSAEPLAPWFRGPNLEAPPKRKPDEVAVFLGTGGTTGFPKMAMLTHRNLVANALQCDAWFPRIVPRNSRISAVIPFFHSFGLTVCLHFALLRGLEVHIFPRLQFPGFFDALHTYPPLLLPGPPSLFRTLNHYLRRRPLAEPPAFAVSGSAPLPVEVLEEYERLTGAILIEGYGLTEASPVTHITPLFGRRKPGSIGVPVPSTEARIADPEDPERTLEVGEEGELLIRGPQVMAGYWKAEEETRETLWRGWLRTGDIARMDGEGFFYILDRKKDLILVSGFNVYPREIEEVARQFPGVEDAAAVGIPDAHTGEAVQLYVQVSEGAQVTPEALHRFLSERLAPHKRPRKIHLCRELPRNFLGKVLRRQLRG